MSAFADANHVRAGTTLGSLFQAGLIDPVDLRVLLQHALGLSHVQLLTQSDRQLSADEALKLNALLNRRLSGEPVAYIAGEREFFSLAFTVSPAVLIPRPETELLVECAAEKLPAKGQALDLGTGSGAIAVALAVNRPDASIVATDISAAALSIARINAARHLKDESRIGFYGGDWYAALPPGSCFDVIVSNPPYIAEGDVHLSSGDLRYEPRHALTDGADGLTAYRMIISGAPDFLKEQGWLLLEHGYDQAEAVQGLLRDDGNWTAIQSWRDLAGIARVTGAQRLG